MSLLKVKLKYAGNWEKVNFNPKVPRKCEKFRKVSYLSQGLAVLVLKWD